MVDLLGLVDKNKLIEEFGKNLKGKNPRVFKYDFCMFEGSFIPCKDYSYVIKTDAYEYEKDYIVLCNDGSVITNEIYSSCNRKLVNFLKNEIVNNKKMTIEVFENVIALNIGENYNFCKEELTKRYKNKLTYLKSYLNNEELTK